MVKQTDGINIIRMQNHSHGRAFAMNYRHCLKACMYKYNQQVQKSLIQQAGLMTFLVDLQYILTI
jgi:hypothetical protein